MLGRCDCYIQPWNGRDKSSFKVWKVSDPGPGLIMRCWASNFGPFHLSIYSGDGLKLGGRRWLGDLNLQSNFLPVSSQTFFAWSYESHFFIPGTCSFLIYASDFFGSLESVNFDVVSGPEISKNLGHLQNPFMLYSSAGLLFWVDFFFMGCCLCGVLLLGSSNTTELSFRNVDMKSKSLGRHENQEMDRPSLKCSIVSGGEMFGAPTVWDFGGTRTQFLLTINNCLWFNHFVWYFDFRNHFLASLPKFEIQDMWSPSVCWCIKALVLSMVPWQRDTRCLCFFASNLKKKKEDWKLA